LGDLALSPASLANLTAYRRHDPDWRDHVAAVRAFITGDVTVPARSTPKSGAGTRLDGSGHQTAPLLNVVD